MVTTPVSLDDQIKAVTRELGFRRHVYARRVSEGKMTQITADKEIAAMEAIGHTLAAIKETADECCAASVEALDLAGLGDGLVKIISDARPKQGSML